MINVPMGTVESDNYLNPKDPMARELIRQAEAESAEQKAQVAEAGAFNLPEQLDKRRREFAIPDGAFRLQAVFDRCLVWQISDFEGNHATEGGLLVMPDTVADRELRETPRGILVSAGLTALDQLRSHGIELGDIVTMIRIAPYHIRCACIAHKWQYLVVLSAGDIIGSEDLAARVRAKETRLQVVEYADPTTKAVAIIHTYGSVQPQMAKMPVDE